VKVSVEATRRLKRPPAADRALKGHDKKNDNKKKSFFLAMSVIFRIKLKLKLGIKNNSLVNGT
jgi:hypothetical protein